MMLVSQIVPLITAAIARGVVKPTGSEDAEELTAEACAMAARALESAERRGKDVPANSVAYYVIENMKSGRRSGYAGMADVMAPATQIHGRSTVVSMDEPISIDEDGDDSDATLHDLLADQREDTDTVAGRRLDWDSVLDRLDDRRLMVLHETAAGYGPSEIGDRLHVSAPRVIQLRQDCGERIVETWGSNGVADATTPTGWRAGLRAGAERRAARSERSARWRRA